MLARKNRVGLFLWGGAVSVSLLLGEVPNAAEPQPAKPAQQKPRKSRWTSAAKSGPVLAKRCFHCHGPDKAESSLRLNSQKSAFAEADSGLHAIVPGKPDDSELITRISETDESLRMPPEGKPLSKEEIETFRRWIAGGAKWETHWAFQPMKNPAAAPSVRKRTWVANPIDAFILHRLEENHLKPAPPANKIALIRRAYYDLTGLPPTPAQVDAFVNDKSPDAYEKLIDDLLESPHYGEQWGRHWLDLVRFAETNSFERDGVKPNAFRYRDYVIRSFNADKPYDQFLREQLAGDELPEVTTDSIIATGYYRLGLWDDEPADPLLAVYNEFDDIITTTSQVFLGLTVNCARCHDHKIDPIPQADYYSMLAFFHELTPYGTRGDQTSNNQTDITPPEVAAQYQALDKQKNELDRPAAGDRANRHRQNVGRRSTQNRRPAARKRAEGEASRTISMRSNGPNTPPCGNSGTRSKPSTANSRRESRPSAWPRFTPNRRRRLSSCGAIPHPRVKKWSRDFPRSFRLPSRSFPNEKTGRARRAGGWSSRIGSPRRTTCSPPA